jgi:hypothetical protein
LKKYWFLLGLIGRIMLFLILLSLPGYTATIPKQSTYNLALELITQERPPKDKKSIKHMKERMILQDGKLTAHIPSAPLNSVMEEFSRLTGVKVLWQDKEVDGPVSAGFTARSPEEAIRQILHGESYLLFYSSTKEGEELARILILPRAGEQKRKIINLQNHSEDIMHLKALGLGDAELQELILLYLT